MLEKRRSLVEEARQARVCPDEPVRTGNRLDDVAHVGVVRVEDEAFLDALVRHERDEAVPVESYVEERELTHVHVSVEDSRLLSTVDTRQDRARYSTPQ